MNQSAETKSNKARITRFIQKKGDVSKPEIASQLGLSMPTVIQIVKALIDEGLVVESGKQKSNGGRKAASLSIAEGFRLSAGIDITSNHISYVVIDLCGTVFAQKRIKRVFENCPGYYEAVNEDLQQFFLENGIAREKIIGAGIALPGIIDKQNKILIRSHILNQNNISLKSIEQIFPHDIAFENDANSALFAEMSRIEANTIYLSLSNSVGGAIFINNGIYEGDSFKSAEFGHMIIRHNGQKCYCGKKGCADAYCSARTLLKYADTLEIFFEQLDNRLPEIIRVWDEYLDHLAVLITNLRMAFDCDIMLGGYVGGYMNKYMHELGRKVSMYNMFENDTLYLKNCSYKREASAIGAAMYFTERFLNRL